MIKLDNAMRALRAAYEGSGMIAGSIIVRDVLDAYDAEQSAPPSEAAREWRERMATALDKAECEVTAAAMAQRASLGVSLQPSVATLLDEAVRIMSRDKPTFVDVVFDDGPGPVSGRFVECEGPDGSSVHAGDWIDRRNGLWALRIPLATPPDDRGLLLQLRRRVQSTGFVWVQSSGAGEPGQLAINQSVVLGWIDELLARAPDPADGEAEESTLEDMDRLLRLLGMRTVAMLGGAEAPFIKAAADEVERLRAENEALRRAETSLLRAITEGAAEHHGKKADAARIVNAIVGRYIAGRQS